MDDCFTIFHKAYEYVTNGDNFGHVCVISRFHPLDSICIFICDDSTPRKCGGQISIFKEGGENNCNIEQLLEIIEYLQRQNCKIEFSSNWYEEWNKLWDSQREKCKLTEDDLTRLSFL